MNKTKTAEVQFWLVALCAAVLVGFTIWRVAVRDISPILLLPVSIIGGVLCSPLLLWRTRWREKAAEAVAVFAALLVLPSLITFGPIFFVPPALLAADGARRLRG